MDGEARVRELPLALVNNETLTHVGGRRDSRFCFWSGPCVAALHLTRERHPGLCRGWGLQGVSLGRSSGRARRNKASDPRARALRLSV
jgi:hypothetical protein